MYIYKVEIDYPDNSSVTSIYDTEQSAIYAAIDKVIDQISCFRHQVSPTDEEIFIYNNIINYINDGHYEKAIDAYNDFPEECPEYEDNHVFIYVIKYGVQSYPAIRYTVPSIFVNEDDKSGEIELNVAPVVKEHPCIHCGKMNDVGIFECWYCGNKPE